MGRIRTLIRSWREDREGRVKLPNDMAKATRDLTGPTGWAATGTWNQLQENRQAYLDSFDRRLPPSLHISERDRVRASLVMPLAERCIEDWDSDHAAADRAETDGEHGSPPEFPTLPEID